MSAQNFKTKDAKTRRVVGYRKSFELTLPATVRRRIEPGDFFRAEMVGAELVLRPVDSLDPEQSWYWTKMWQKRESRADADMRAGRVTGPFHSVQGFMKGLSKK